MAITSVKVNSVVHMASAPRGASASGKSGASNAQQLIRFAGSPNRIWIDDFYLVIFFWICGGKIGETGRKILPTSMIH
jgi:hypothetical protein